jgi:two-component system LytT family response regulator/two-component system response regulator LytT
MQRCLIVDDEKPAREELLYMLSNFTYIEVVGQASHGMEALELIDRLRPDIVFLDIQMPKMSGMDVARKVLNREYKPIIIFVSAYDKFAVEAFEVNAIDYLLKPVSEERLKDRLDKINEERTKEGTIHTNKMVELFGYIKENTKESSPKRISLYRNGILIPIETKEILYATIEDKNTIIVSNKGKFETSCTLNELVDKLDSTMFFRTHKSYIVNLNYIESIEPWFNSTYNINLKNNKEVIPVSRFFSKSFKAIMNIE